MPQTLGTSSYINTGGGSHRGLTFTAKGTYDATATPGAGRISPGAGGSSITSITKSETTATNPWKVLMEVAVSDPLTAETSYSGTLNLIRGISEANADADCYWGLHVWVSVGNTDVVRATLLNNYVENTTNEFPTTAAGLALQAAQALSGTWQKGDRVVVETCAVFRNTHTTARNIVLRRGTVAGNSDLTVGSTSVTTLNGTFAFSPALTLAAPANDLIADATTIASLPYSTLGVELQYATGESGSGGANRDPFVTGDFWTMGQSLWWKYVATYTGNLYIYTEGSGGTGIRVSVFDDPAATIITSAADGTDIGSAVDPTESVPLTVAISSGTTYYLMVGFDVDNTFTRGDLDLYVTDNLASPFPPVNDNCADALQVDWLDLDYSDSQVTTAATTEYGAYGYREIFYKYTNNLVSRRLRVRASPTGGTEIRLTQLAGTCGSFTTTTFDVDTSQAQIILDIDNATPIYFVVGSTSDVATTITFTIEEIDVPDLATWEDITPHTFIPTWVDLEFSFPFDTAAGPEPTFISIQRAPGPDFDEWTYVYGDLAEIDFTNDGSARDFNDIQWLDGNTCYKYRIRYRTDDFGFSEWATSDPFVTARSECPRIGRAASSYWRAALTQAEFEATDASNPLGANTIPQFGLVRARVYGGNITFIDTVRAIQIHNEGCGAEAVQEGGPHAYDSYLWFGILDNLLTLELCRDHSCAEGQLAPHTRVVQQFQAALVEGTLDQCHDYAFTYNVTTGEVKLYQNGTTILTDTWDGAPIIWGVTLGQWSYFSLGACADAQFHIYDAEASSPSAADIHRILISKQLPNGGSEDDDLQLDREIEEGYERPKYQPYGGILETPIMFSLWGEDHLGIQRIEGLGGSEWVIYEDAPFELIHDGVFPPVPGSPDPLIPATYDSCHNGDTPCEATPTPDQGALIVIKHVSGVEDPDTEFTIEVTGDPSLTTLTLQHDEFYLFNNLPAQAGYAVTENTPPNGYSLSSITVSNGSPSNNITIANFEVVTVTVTNVQNVGFASSNTIPCVHASYYRTIGLRGGVTAHQLDGAYRTSIAGDGAYTRTLPERDGSYRRTITGLKGDF